MATPTELMTPPVDNLWDKSKKKAEDTAKSLDSKNKDKKDKSETQVSLYNQLKKSFNKDLSKHLTNWPKLYPDYDKMKSVGKAIDDSIKAYREAIHNSRVDDSIKSILNLELTRLSKIQSDRDDKAKKLFEKEVKPIEVLVHKDILGLAIAKAGGASALKIEGECPIRIVIDKYEILNKFRDDHDYANQAQKIKDAADFQRLVSEIADAIKESNANVVSGKKTADEEKKALEANIKKATEACAERATDEAGRQAKLKGEARWANIESGLKLTLTTVGVAAGVTSLAFGVTTIAGCIGLSKAVVELGKQLYALGSDLNELTASAADDIKKMKSGYDQWLGLLDKNKENPKSWEIGVLEFGKRGANALLPTWATTIKSVKEKVEACEQKCNNIEVKSNDLGDKLSKMLTQQMKADNAIKSFVTTIQGSITPKENEVLVALLKKLIATEKSTGSLIENVSELNKKVSTGQAAIAKLQSDLKPIDAANPTWSKVASALFETTASAGYMFLASSGAPEPLDFAKKINDVVEKTHQVDEVIEMTVNLGEGLADAFKKKSKH